MKPIKKMRVVDIKRFPSGQIVTTEKMVPIVGRTVAQVDADEARSEGPKLRPRSRAAARLQARKRAYGRARKIRSNA